MSVNIDCFQICHLNKDMVLHKLVGEMTRETAEVLVHVTDKDQYRCVLYLSGEKLDDDKQDAAVPEVFIDQDQVLLKVCKYSKQHTVNIFIFIFLCTNN